MNRPQECETHVLIIGGSIVGLTMALACERQGIQYILAEKHEAASEHPRASRYNARAMEVFRALGVEEDVRAAGKDLERLGGSISGPTLLSALEKGSANTLRNKNPEEGLTPAPAARAAQSRVEPVLRSIAESRGGDLRFGTEISELTETPDWVTAKALERKTGREQVIAARYVVAADGASGKTRGWLGIEREELGVAGHYVNILFDVDLRSLIAGREFGNCILRQPKLSALLHAFEGGSRWRLQLVHREPLSLDRCAQVVRDALGIADLNVHLVGAQPWQAASAMARAYRRGRVLLAGDAAHQMAPFLGLGASTGIQDAHNLAWKLAWVLRGSADVALLDSYEKERLPIARRAVIASSQAGDDDGLPRMNHAAVFADRWMMLGLEAGSDPQDEGQPGKRVPHEWLPERDGSPVSTLDLGRGEFALLTGPDREPSTVVRTFRLESDSWLSRARIGKDGALLVRPDGLIAWRSPHADEDVAEKLRQMLGYHRHV